MKRNKTLILAGFIVLLVIMFYSFSGDDPELILEKYTQQIDGERREKNAFMRRDDTSPFVINALDFEGLKYFDPDLKYRIEGDFIEMTRNEILRLPTNDGKENIYVKKGVAEFEFEGERHRLLVLMTSPPIDNMLFIPFADATSGEETYGGGRYLEAELQESGKIELDFNNAYNPYCAYVANFSCPLPPRENYLSISIKAGEKNYD